MLQEVRSAIRSLGLRSASGINEHTYGRGLGIR